MNFKIVFLHSIGTISFGTVFAASLNLLGFSGYFAGFATGAFYMWYYFVGLNLIEAYQRN